jgi:hypothetical protein
MAEVAVIGIGNRHGDERSGREATSSPTELAAVPVPQGETGLPIGNPQDSQSATQRSRAGIHSARHPSLRPDPLRDCEKHRMIAG